MFWSVFWFYISLVEKLAAQLIKNSLNGQVRQTDIKFFRLTIITILPQAKTA